MNNFYSTALAKVLKQWREDFGYNVNFIAKKLDANPHTIARFESGKGGVSLELGLKYLDFATSRMPANAIWRQYLSALKTAKEEQNNLEISAETSPPDAVGERQRHSRYFDARQRAVAWIPVRVTQLDRGNRQLS